MNWLGLERGRSEIVCANVIPQLEIDSFGLFDNKYNKSIQPTDSFMAR